MFYNNNNNRYTTTSAEVTVVARDRNRRESPHALTRPSPLHYSRRRALSPSPVAFLRRNSYAVCGPRLTIPTRSVSPGFSVNVLSMSSLCTIGFARPARVVECFCKISWMSLETQVVVVELFAAVRVRSAVRKQISGTQWINSRIGTISPG